MFSKQCFKISSSSRILFRALQYSTLNINLQHSLQPSCNLKICRNIRALLNHGYCTTIPNAESKDGAAKTALKEPRYKAISQEELLEKFIAGLSSDIYLKHRVYKNDLMRVINKIKELNFSSKRQGLLLLRCCTELLPDEAPAMRMNLVELIWKTLKPHTKFTTDHYNELLRVYIANNRTLNVSSFIQQMSPMKPTMVTFELLVEALAEAGDINQATEVIANMKTQGFPASEAIFNSLILCQGKARHLNNIKEILVMMKSLNIGKTQETSLAIAKGLIWNKKPELMLEELRTFSKGGLQFEERHIMEIVKMCALANCNNFIPKVLSFLPRQTLTTPSISAYMQSVATLLVFQNNPLAALEIYKCLPLPAFGPNDDKGLHGRSLVRDCVKANLPTNVIYIVTEQLMTTGRNPIAVQNACEAALQLGKVPLALDMFAKMKEIGLPLRPHYFWPIFLSNSKTFGEKGIMNTIKTMSKMDVKPDYDTIVNFTLPHVSFTSPQNLMKKFQENGLSVSTVLTPMMEILLASGQIRAASELSEIFKGKIDASKLFKPLVKGYQSSLDVKSTIHVLEEICEKTDEKGRDCVGRFLCEFTKHKNFKQDVAGFKNIVKELISSNLRISQAAQDACLARLPEKLRGNALESIKADLFAITDEKLIDDGDIFEHQIKHPNKMDEEGLRSHLKELESKGMNTRGVLRKLLQKYCQQRNLTEATAILDKCKQEGVFLSAGMRASIFDLYVKLGELDMAEECLADLNKNSPNFTLDEFKIIDFATLMVYRNKLDKSLELIVEQSKNRHISGGRAIETNCWRLLDAMAATGDVEYVTEMFNALTLYGYCQPTNVILGPLIRVHLKNNSCDLAVEEFIRLSSKYRKTPLKHELLCKILIEMNDEQGEDNFVFNEKANSKLNKLAQSVLNVDKEIHGVSSVQLSVIGALAEVGYKKTLRKIFLDPTMKFHPDAILRRCERFALEKKISALETIAECAKDLRHVDIDRIYDMMLTVYQREDDTKGALALWYKMFDNDVTPSKKFVNNITSLLKANNKDIPPEILGMLDKDVRSAIINS